MLHSPYARYTAEDMSLRDMLAVDRTLVANERTFLGYLRTSLALVVSGGSLLHFFEDWWALVSGILLIWLGAGVLYVGARHYIVRRRALSPLIGVQEGTALPDDHHESRSEEVSAAT